MKNKNHELNFLIILILSLVIIPFQFQRSDGLSQDNIIMAQISRTCGFLSDCAPIESICDSDFVNATEFLRSLDSNKSRFFGFHYRGKGGFVDMYEGLFYNSTSNLLTGDRSGDRLGPFSQYNVFKSLSESEEKQLANIITENKFFELPPIFPEFKTDAIRPCLTIAIDDKIHTVEWTDTSLLEPSIIGNIHLRNILDAIRQILNGTQFAAG